MFPRCCLFNQKKKINFRKLPAGTLVWDPCHNGDKFTRQCLPLVAVRKGNLLLTNRYRCHETILEKLKIGSVWSRADKPDHYYLMVAADKSYDLSTGELIDHYAKYLPVTIHEAKLMVGMNDD